MNSEEKQVLFDLKVKDDSLIKTLAAIQVEEKKTKDELKELTKEYEKNAEQIVTNELRLKQLSTQKGKLTAVTKKETDQNKAATGSVVALKKEIISLEKAYNELSEEERKNSDIGGKLAKQIKSLRDDVKDAAEATGKKGLAGSLKEAIAENTQFGKSVTAVGTAVKANPIGFIVTALISLLGVLKESKPFMDFFEQQVAKVNAVVNVLKDRLFTIAGALKELIAGNPGKAWELIKESVKGVWTEIGLEIEQNKKLLESRQKLDRERIESQSRNKQLIAEEERLKTIRDDETKSIGERLKANEAAFKIEQERRKMMEDLAQRNLDLINEDIRIRGGRDKINNEELQKVIDAETELAEVREDSEGRLVEFITNRNSLNKEASEVAKKLMEDSKKLFEQLEADALAIRDELLASTEFSPDEIDKEIQRIADSEKAKQDAKNKIIADGLALAKQLDQEEADAADQALERKKRAVQREIEIERTKYGVLSDITQGIALLGDILADSSEESAAIQKAAALAQIAIDTALAISALTKSSQQNALNGATAGLAGVAQFAGGIIQILANIAQAKKLINSFYDGGMFGYTGDGNPHDESSALGSKPYTYHKRELIVNHQTLETPEGAALGARLMDLMNKNTRTKGKGFITGGIYDGGVLTRQITSAVDGQKAVSQNASALTLEALKNANIIVKVDHINKAQADQIMIKADASL
jgi:hypothetical protein